MLLSVLEASFTLRCNMCTLTIVVHCKGAWWSRCELCGLGAVWVCELYLFGCRLLRLELLFLYLKNTYLTIN
jgi:hypothetical protein